MKIKIIAFAVVLVSLAAALIHNTFRLDGTYAGRVGGGRSVQIELANGSAILTADHVYDGPLTGTYTVTGGEITLSLSGIDGTPLEIKGTRDGKTIVLSGDSPFPDMSLMFRTTLDRILGWMPALLRASWTTLSITFLSVGLSLLLAVFLALGKISKNPVINPICRAYIFFFRGTPLLMQLFFIYFALPEIHTAFTIRDRFTAAVIAFTLNIAAYIAEIIRAAIQSIDKGQMEASKAMGLTYAQAMRLVIIPQAYRRMIPPVCNEFVMVLKDTSIVFVIGLVDLTTQTRQIQNSNATALVFIPAMILYLLMTGMFTAIFNRVERKLSVYESDSDSKLKMKAVTRTRKH
jgi:polar amino acid transport system permease protein